MIWLFTFIILVLFITLMSTGVFLSKKTIAGSCGGLNKLGLKEDCPICGHQPRKTVKSDADQHVSFYDATQNRKT